MSHTSHVTLTHVLGLRGPVLLALVLQVALLTSAVAEDWPTYQHDNSRSGLTKDSLSYPLRQLWVHQPAHAPAPAWPAPAKADIWQRINNLDPRVTYDRAFQVAVSGGRVYYGSSADDQVVCLDATTGARRWTSFTEGPVRLAPTVSEGRVYFGSDDGWVYCVDADTGALVWKQQPAEVSRRIAGNSRIISAFPCRTGVLVSGTVAYATSGLFPDNGVYLCALDARSGEILWRRKSPSLSPQGYLLASPTRLFAPTGRTSPALFKLTDGTPLGTIGGLGGTYAVLSGDTLNYAYGRESNGLIATSDVGTTERVASFDGVHLIVDGEMSYLQSRTQLQALDRTRYMELVTAERSLTDYRSRLKGELTAATEKGDEAAKSQAQKRMAETDEALTRTTAQKNACYRWTTPCRLPFALVKAGDALIAGGDGRVAAYDCRTGAVLWQSSVEGRAAGLAVADGQLYVSTETGLIYAFGAGAPGDQAPAATPEEPSAATTAGLAGLATPQAIGQRPTNDQLPPGLVGRWIFDSAHLQGTTVKDLAGNHDATLSGDIKLDESTGALVLAGKNTRVALGTVENGGELPREALSVEAWIRVDEITRWGGILSALQDNGTFEKGWHLGSEDNRFRFAVSSVGADDGDGKVTYLSAPTTFEAGKWYHVVGTYDGREQRIFLNGELQASLRDQSGPILYPPQAPYTLGAYQDDDEFLPTTGALAEVRVYDRALTRAQVRADYLAYPELCPVSLQLAAGPYVEYTSPSRVRLGWETAAAGTCKVSYHGPGAAPVEASAGPLGKTHELVLSGLQPGTEYEYQITFTADGKPQTTDRMTFETTEGPGLDPVDGAASPYPADSTSDLYREAAKRVVAQTGVDQGYCFVLGTADGHLAYEIAKLTRLQVVCVEPDPARATRAREMLSRAGVYGTRVSVHQGKLKDLGYAEYAANLVVCEDMTSAAETIGSAEDVLRLVRPCGGRAYLGSLRTPERKPVTRSDLETWLGKAADPGVFACSFEDSAAQDSGPWGQRVVVERKSVSGGGRWTHMYADPGNTAATGETHVVGPMQVQWFGRPGPRFMVDRHHRTVPPLVAEGRIIIPGSNRILAVDAYNGTQLWDVGIHNSRRVCGPRTTSQLALEGDRLYVAAADTCWRLDLQSGAVRQVITTPQLDPEEAHDWGYVAAVDGKLLGTGARPGAIRREMNRGAIGETYYDDRPVQTSDYLFCLDPKTQRPIWTYKEGVIVDTTISVGEGRIFFLEAPVTPAVKDSLGRTALQVLFAQGADLVALDLQTGQQVYRKPVDTANWRHVVWTAYAEGIVLATGSTNREGRAWYYLTAYKAATGEVLWQADHPNNRPGIMGGHGEQDHHPVITNGVVYAEPVAYELATGKRVNPLGAEGSWETPLRGGCGTMSGAAQALFYRDGNPTRYLLGAGGGPGKLSLVNRPGCWINIIPAGGLVVIPEASSGCTCSYPLQTSLALAPVEPGG